jgi:hypothetical protein
MPSAKKEQLVSIHEKLATSIEKRVKSASEEDGDPLTAAEITAIAKFLKDNGEVIDLPSSPPETPGKSIGHMPFPTRPEGNSETVN